MPTRDLSHPLDPDTWTYPGDPPVSVEPYATFESDGYRVSSLSFGTHAGTHVDAPSHTEPDGATVEELPVDAFAFDAMRVGLGVGAREPIHTGALPEVPEAVDCLVLDTGWGAHWGTDRYLDHPYLTAAAAAWCAEGGLCVAVDAPSVDPSPPGSAIPDADEPRGHPAHHEVLGAGLVIVENLTNLDDLPDRFELRAYPLPISGGDGSPVRTVAEW